MRFRRGGRLPATRHKIQAFGDERHGSLQRFRVAFRLGARNMAGLQRGEACLRRRRRRPHFRHLPVSFVARVRVEYLSFQTRTLFCTNHRMFATDPKVASSDHGRAIYWCESRIELVEPELDSKLATLSH